MKSSLFYNTDSLILSVLLFLGIVLFYFLGFKISQHQRRRNPENEPAGFGPFEGAMLGLLSLLLGFTFNMAASRFDMRKEQILHEANCIGTVLLRADLYPDSVRREFRSDLEVYIKERIQYYEAGGDEKEIKLSLQKANSISERIWNRAAIISQKNEVVIKSMQMVPAVNEMIDVVTSREEIRNAHVPESIFGMLFILCFAGSFIVGYSCKSKKADLVILFSYSLMTVMTVYLILDLDKPRQGIINTSLTHQNMYDLQNSFHENAEVKK